MKNNLIKIKKIILLFLGLFLISLISATANVQLSDQGTGVVNSTDDLQSGDLTVLIYDNETGGSLIYNETFSDAINDGFWNVMLGSGSENLSLEFGEIYYKDYLILGEDASFDGEDRQAFYSPLGDISGEDLQDNTNITTTGYGFFGWLGSLASRITTLFVQDIDASGDINASDYTLNGTTIEDWSDVGSSSGASSYYYDKTSTSYTGSLSSGGYMGYIAGNYICDAEFSGTHLCYESEVILTMGYSNVSAMTQWSDYAWIITGGAKYSPAPIPVNDCNGFTHGVAGTYLGSFWLFNQTSGGVGGLTHCGNSLPLACCKEGGYP